jgi:hypothetical protein
MEGQKQRVKNELRKKEANRKRRKTEINMKEKGGEKWKNTEKYRYTKPQIKIKSERRINIGHLKTPLVNAVNNFECQNKLMNHDMRNAAVTMRALSMQR